MNAESDKYDKLVQMIIDGTGADGVILILHKPGESAVVATKINRESCALLCTLTALNILSEQLYRSLDSRYVAVQMMKSAVDPEVRKDIQAAAEKIKSFVRLTPPQGHLQSHPQNLPANDFAI